MTPLLAVVFGFQLIIKDDFDWVAYNNLQTHLQQEGYLNSSTINLKSKYDFYNHDGEFNSTGYLAYYQNLQVKTNSSKVTEYIQTYLVNTTSIEDSTQNDDSGTNSIYAVAYLLSILIGIFALIYPIFKFQKVVHQCPRCFKTIGEYRPKIGIKI